MTSICTGVGDKFLWMKFEQMMTSKRRASWMIRVVYKVGLIPSPLYSAFALKRKNNQTTNGRKPKEQKSKNVIKKFGEIDMF